MPEQNLPTPEQLREKDKQFAIEPPRMTVLSDHPILREDDAKLGLEPDSFGLRARLGAVYDIIRHKNTRAPIAIAIYGDWGTGKSSAMRWLRDQLALWSKQSKEHRAGHTKVRTVWFDPWKYQKRDDVWRGLIAEVIIHSIDIKNASLATVTDATKKFGLFLGRSFLNVLSSAKVKAGAAEIDLDVLKKIAEDYREAAHPEKAYLNEFETALKDWVSDSLKGDERMVVFIDDLDRCLPEITFEVLEALKLYLNIPKLIFVVGLDRRVVESYVKHHYKKDEVDESKAQHYLDKMFQVEVEIPPSQMQIKGYLDQQINALNKACDDYWSSSLGDAWDGKHRSVIEDTIRGLAQHNPREIKRLLNSTLLRAAAAARNMELGGTEPERFTQGAQVFLIQRILRRDVPDSANLMLENRTLEFFSRWSRFVGTYPEFRTREEVQSRQSRRVTTVTLSEMWGRKEARKEVLVEAEGNVKRDFEQLRDLQPRYRGTVEDEDEAYPLLQNDDLWDLMRIPFSTSVASATATDHDKQEELRLAEQTNVALTMPSRPAAQAATPTEPRRLSDIPRAVLSAVAKSLRKDVNQVVDDDFVAVRELDLSNADLKSVSSLAWLKNLEKLDLNKTQVSDVSPLAELQNLQWLYLRGTQVSDVSPLANLQNLQWLDLNGTEVSDITSLAKLRNLQGLDLSGTQVSEFSHLARFPNLQWLELHGTRISDVSPLAKLQNVRAILLSRTVVSDVSHLAELLNLQVIDVGGTQVSDVSPLANLQNLQVIDLSGTQVSDVSPLANLQNLQVIDLSGTQVSDVSPLANLQNLQGLFLGSTQVSDVSSLANLQNLKWLDLSGTQVSVEQVDKVKELRPRLEIIGP